jgi:hypothetical protein
VQEDVLDLQHGHDDRDLLDAAEKRKLAQMSKNLGGRNLNYFLEFFFEI